MLSLSLAGVTSWVLCRQAPGKQECPPHRACLPPTSDPLLRYQDFDAQRALQTACTLAQTFGARPGGSARERRVAEWLARRLKALGYETRLQDGIPVGHGLTTANAIGLRRHPGEPRHVLIGAHMDSIRRPGCVGANDNASGVGVTLELARLLATAPVPYSVEIVFFGAEEQQGSGSLFGSGYYAATAARRQALPLAMICMDMVGRGDWLCLWHGGPRDHTLAALFADSAGRLDLPLHTAPNPEGSDHVPFAWAGVPAAWLQRLPDAANHTRYDVPANLDPEALQQAGRLLARVLLAMDKDDLEGLQHPANVVAKP